MMSEERMIYGGAHRLEQPPTLPWIAEGKLGWCRSKTSWDDRAYYRHGASEMAIPVDHACGECPVLVHHVTGPAISDVDAAGCQCGACQPPPETMAGPWPAPDGVDHVYRVMSDTLRGLQRAAKEGCLTDEAALEVQSWLDAIQRRVEKLKARE